VDLGATSLLPEDLAAEVQKVVDRHCHETLYVPGGSASVYLMDYTGDWQARSRRLYEAAAKVAEKIGLDVDRTAFGEASQELGIILDGKALQAGSDVSGTLVAQASRL